MTITREVRRQGQDADVVSAMADVLWNLGTRPPSEESHWSWMLDEARRHLEALAELGFKVVKAPTPRVAVAVEVHRLRLLSGFSQETLAALSGVSTSSIIRIERGETPRLSTLSSIAAALGVTAASLMGPAQEASA